MLLPVLLLLQTAPTLVRPPLAPAWFATAADGGESDGGEVDAGSPADAGSTEVDAGPVDAGPEPVDAGPEDAGQPPIDAGPEDAGPTTIDAGLLDAGPADAGSTPVDAGAPLDAGATPDAGSAPVDAGPTPDAGPLRDAGSVVNTEGDGSGNDLGLPARCNSTDDCPLNFSCVEKKCRPDSAPTVDDGCSSLGGGSALLALLGTFVGLRSRRRRS